jgi:hypothetical protein
MTDKPTVFEALSAVMDDVQAVKKGDRNTQQNYNFRGIDAVVNAVGPVLRKHGVIAVPHSTDAHYRDVQTSTGKPSRECTVKVTYRFYGPAGDYLDVEVPGEAMDFGDKGAPKAMSVAYRIALLQALCIPTDDPEPDAQSYQREVDISASRPAERRNARDISPTTDPDPFVAPVVTDAAWIDGFRARLTACTKPSEVRGLDEEAHVQYADGKLTAEDAKVLKGEIDARMQELTGALV